MESNNAFACCFSHIGKRLNHEDNFFMNGTYLTSDFQCRMSDIGCCFFNDSSVSKVKLFAVSDGMGGHNAGEVASRICVEKLASVYEELQRCFSLGEIVSRLQSVIAETNKEVYDFGCTQKNLKGMGATLMIVVLFGGQCAVLNIGDSRAYHFCNGQLLQITKDHTEGQRMLDLGLLDRNELLGFPARKNLNRYIGYYQNGYVLCADEYYPSSESEFLLLCSDGISDYLSDRRMTEILSNEENFEIAGRQLINEAVASRGADNATVILIPLRR